MGFLTDGKTLDWEQAQEHLAYIKEHGIIQFLNIYKKFKDRQDNVLLWGDEVINLLKQNCSLFHGYISLILHIQRYL
jgi:glutamate--cysteine ligase catalytic subunit